MIAIQSIVTDWYTPKSEEDEAKPMSFKYQTLNGRQGLYVSAEVEKRREQFKISIVGIMYTLENCLLDWKNFFDLKGNEIEFHINELERIPTPILAEVANFIIDESDLFGVQEKNSSSQSQ